MGSDKKWSVDALEYVPYENPGQHQVRIMPGDTVRFYGRNERTGEVFEIGTSVAEADTPRDGYECVKIALPADGRTTAISD